MSTVRLVSPTKAVLELTSAQITQLKPQLTYTDLVIQGAINRHRKTLKAMEWKPDFFQGQFGERGYYFKLKWFREEIEKLEKTKVKTLVFKDGDFFWTWAGLARTVSRITNSNIVREYDLPEPKLLPWAHVPKHPNRHYQDKAVEALIDAATQGMASVEIPTGGGKTAICRTLAKHYSLKTVVVCPSVSIARQTYRDFKYHFGDKYVGFFGDGSKMSKKLITIAIDKSLVRLKPKDEHYKNFQQCQVIIYDECHLSATETAVDILSDVLSGAPYRFSVTATWMRNDGKDLLLEGFTGSPTYEIGLQQLVKEGFLAKPNIKIVKFPPAEEAPGDPNENTRVNLYYHPQVCEFVGELANRSVDQKKPVLILIDEIEQFSKLLPHLKHPVVFAHGDLLKVHKETIPEQYWESKYEVLVDRFNAGEVPILIGTSAVATGTDFQVPEVGIYLVGGKSPIALSQGFGRMTRGGENSTVYNPWTSKQKTQFEWWDFDVMTESTHRHTDARREIYQKIGPIEEITHQTY